MWAEENISTSIQVNGETVPQWEFKDVWVKKPTLNEKKDNEENRSWRFTQRKY